MPKTHAQFLHAIVVMILCFESKQAMCQYKYGAMRYGTLDSFWLTAPGGALRRR
jgi:hypothetical protein